MGPITLLYHDILDENRLPSGFSTADAEIYKIEAGEFRSHLEKIREATGQGTVVVLSGAAASPGARTVLLTFDDGGVSAYSTTADLLEEHGWRGRFFVTTDYIGQPGFLSRGQIRELRRRGHGIGSHSCSHPPRMAALTRTALQQEWGRSAGALADILGERIRTASVPGGYYSRAVAESAANSGIEVLFNSEPTTSTHTINGCLVLGRYSIQRGVSAEVAAAIVRGAVMPRWKQFAYWNFKKILKAAGGRYWLEARKRLLEHARTRSKTA